jgi:hypothetical protein
MMYLPELLTLGRTDNVNKSPSWRNVFLISRTNAVNCSLCSSAFSSTTDSPTILCFKLLKKEPEIFFVATITNQSSLTLLIFPRIFFGLVSGNSQARSKPSKPKFLTRECAEFTNARRCSTDSSCERTFSKSRSKKRQQKLTMVLYLMLPSSPWSSFPPTDRSTLNPGNLLLRAVM